MYLSLLQAWNKYSVVVVNPIIACTPQSIVQNTLDFFRLPRPAGRANKNKF